MKKVTILILVLIIASVGIVLARISTKENKEIQKAERFNTIGDKNKSDLTSWD
ncbi:MAG: hypothetical protein H7Y13_13940 [Sphingobacteriaceae bacterium]|nr:hypothetical protein [Sphingobacteriaceae bacterium]